MAMKRKREIKRTKRKRESESVDCETQLTICFAPSRYNGPSDRHTMSFNMLEMKLMGIIYTRKKQEATEAISYSDPAAAIFTERKKKSCELATVFP